MMNYLTRGRLERGKARTLAEIAERRRLEDEEDDRLDVEEVLSLDLSLKTIDTKAQFWRSCA